MPTPDHADTRNVIDFAFERNPDAPFIQDENLYSSASAQWRECRERMLELLGGLPAIRAAIRQQIKQRWDLDSQLAGLRFHTGQRLYLDEASVFVLQFPHLDPALDQASEVFGLPAAHALHGLSPMALLETLKRLELGESLNEQWIAYWNGRATGTALSRRSWAARQYHAHFQAAGDIAVAEGTLTVRQWQALQTALPRPDSSAVPAGFETLHLTLADGSRLKLPGALVCTSDSERILYLPSYTPAMQVFATRAAMERNLLDRQRRLWPYTGNELRPRNTVGYQLQDAPLDAAFRQLMSQLRACHLTPLHENSEPDPGSAASAPLAAADAYDNARATNALFAELPGLAPLTNDGESPRPTDFGNLYQDIPLSTRLAMIEQQLQAFESLAGEQDDHDSPTLQTLREALNALSMAQSRADIAAASLLDTEALHDLRSWSQDAYAELKQARQDGLRAEAAIQYAMNQLGDDEREMLDAVLLAPTADQRSASVITATLTLQTTGDDQQLQSQPLDGVVVIAHGNGPYAVVTDRPLLLFWPGSAGGLQRFASVMALERELFKLSIGSDERKLLLTPLAGDALEHGLQRQLARCEQAALELHQHLFPRDEAQYKTALEELRRTVLDELNVPVNTARDLAYERFLEQNRSLALNRGQPEWLRHLPPSERQSFSALIKAFLPAAQRSQALLERDLPRREDFAARQVTDRLVRDFALGSAVQVQLDVPDSTHFTKDTIPGSGAPGTPLKLVLMPSKSRSLISLQELALGNIDHDLTNRLQFMGLVLTGGDPADRSTLASGLDVAYLQRFVTELDLAGLYEQRIRDALLGTVDAPLFHQQYREECLLAPVQLMLAIRGQAALHQRHITQAGLDILSLATDASSPEAFNTGGKRVSLLPAMLMPGGEDTGDRNTPLSGVTFIHDSVSGVTLLYLPDSPDAIFLRQYDGLETARVALFNLAFDSNMAAYLADRALEGDMDYHISRINEACTRHFQGLIGIEQAWPATTSLAAQQLNAHLGRLVLAHRSTSRSNRELRLELAALESGKVFDYLKMALGMLPFVGVVIAAYDAWASANRAVTAFLHNNAAEGLDALESLLQSLIDAAMDLLPGAAIKPGPARALIRQRQLKQLVGSGHLRPAPGGRRRTAVDRFSGYEYGGESSLAGLTPGTEGIYRGIYRHPQGDFIINSGRVYPVLFDAGRHTWRLTGKADSAYKQPIALDGFGNWDTHGALYGVNVISPVAGGGAALGRLAEFADPLWPAAIRQHLPRWWTDPVLRRQQALKSSVDAKLYELQTINSGTQERQNRFNQMVDPEARNALTLELRDRYVKERAIGSELYPELEALMQLSTGNNRTRLKALQSRVAWLQVDRRLNELNIIKPWALEHLARIDEIGREIETTPTLDIPRHLQLLQQRKQVRLKLVKKLDQVSKVMHEAEIWNKRITVAEQRANVQEDMEVVQQKFSQSTTELLKVGNYLEIVNRYEAVVDTSWFLLQQRIAGSRIRLDRALNNQLHLTEVRTSAVLRERVLRDCLETYQDYHRDFLAWNASYPQFFEQRHVQPFLDGLRYTAELAERWRKKSAFPTHTRQPGPAQPARRLFETEDNQVLMGIEENADRQRRMTIPGINNNTEIYVEGQQGRWRLENPRPAPASAPADLNQLVREARERLDNLPAYTAKVQGYARKNMLPVDLEHMLVSEAGELRTRATLIAEQDPQASLPDTLRARADELVIQGQALRIRQTLASKTPSEGMLDYLLEHQSVDIIKVGEMTQLTKRAEGRAEYLLEYEIRDLTRNPPGPLWYAHFHYTSASPGFDSFAKAHLKIPEQRRRGLQWQQGQGESAERIWRGDIGRVLARKHFAALFD
ncbi:dermonecrotic toxin domain-containing protein [Pseudomonas sp. Marseille-P9899]|uniref:dermonecrotic toxin domain-containing protein n=1 Tax=Pseudomonas sp. Marseille-P9899 TaxID=2730401 RepID=UPI0015899E8D|nr:DUF6543 domain-containing protein [Pseudomonas sp. Marseille-P9899]